MIPFRICNFSLESIQTWIN